MAIFFRLMTLFLQLASANAQQQIQTSISLPQLPQEQTPD